VLVVTPYYNKPSRRGLVEHFKAVAGATDRPVMIYNIPARSMINLDAALQIELAKKIDNVVAVKQAYADTEEAKRIMEEAGLALYAGDDNLLRPFAEIGGAGGVCVTSHLLGERMKEMYEAARSGDRNRANEIDEELKDAYKAIFMTVGTATMKAALNILGFEAGGLRLPLVKITGAEEARVRAMLERHGLVPSAA
jgi:4-hydroxy-tetrahydrodipicolinate synthase